MDPLHGMNLNMAAAMLAAASEFSGPLAVPVSQNLMTPQHQDPHQIQMLQGMAGLPPLHTFRSAVPDSLQLQNIASNAPLHIQLPIKTEDGLHSNMSAGASLSSNSNHGPSSLSPAGMVSALTPGNTHSRKPSGDSIESSDSYITAPKLEPAPGVTGATGGGGGGSGSGHRQRNFSKQALQCPKCGKVFSNSSAIAKHKLTHSDERKYTCNICSKAFKRQDHLNGHRLTHQEKKPHACNYCEKSYSDARSLRRHYENAHQGELRQMSSAIVRSPSMDSPLQEVVSPADGDIRWNPLDEPKNVECSVCKKMFKNQAALNGHMRLHGGYNMQPRRDDGPPSLQPMPPVVTQQQQQMGLWQQIQDEDSRGVEPEPTQPPPVVTPTSTANNIPGPMSDLSLLNNIGDTSLHTSLESIFQGIQGIQGVNETLYLESFLGKATPPSGPSITPPQYSPITPSYVDPMPHSHNHKPASLDFSTPSSVPVVIPGANLDPTLSDLNSSTLNSTLENVLNAAQPAGQQPRPPLLQQALSLPLGATWPSPGAAHSAAAATLFRDPQPPRRKNRPAPLVIPAHVSTYAFHSRLRSPRIWKPNSSAPGGGGGGAFMAPPYTPPPMLSPMRQGSGLFWRAAGPLAFSAATSAPVTPKFWPQQVATSQQVVQIEEEVAAEQEEEEEEEMLEDETDSEPPPPTDILPKINIGEQYQADLPEFTSRSNVVHTECADRLMWDPECERNLTEDEIAYYLRLSCSAAIPEGGLNQEYALHLLHRSNGDLRAAITALLENSLKLCVDDPLADYTYAETETWTVDEANRFTDSLSQNDKDFYLVSQDFLQQGFSRSVKQCVEFYYLWKHTWPHEYRALRNRWRQRRMKRAAGVPGGSAGAAGACGGGDNAGGNGWYNLRSREPEAEAEPVPAEDVASSLQCYACGAHLPSDGPLHDCPLGEAAGAWPLSPSVGGSVGLDIGTAADLQGHYPCKLCPKVFTKIKSRNAHMKSHSDRSAANSMTQHFELNVM